MAEANPITLTVDLSSAETADKAIALVLNEVVGCFCSENNLTTSDSVSGTAGFLGILVGHVTHNSEKRQHAAAVVVLMVLSATLSAWEEKSGKISDKVASKADIRAILNAALDETEKLWR
jgi:hypothetical protein